MVGTRDGLATYIHTHTRITVILYFQKKKVVSTSFT